MMKTAAILLCVVSVACAVPFGFFPNSYATGSAGANVVSGLSGGPYQNSQVTQLSAYAQGSSSGNSYSNNGASASNYGSSGGYGNQQISNTNAFSNQQSFGRGGYRRPNNYYG